MKKRRAGEAPPSTGEATFSAVSASPGPAPTHTPTLVPAPTSANARRGRNNNVQSQLDVPSEEQFVRCRIDGCTKVDLHASDVGEMRAHVSGRNGHQTRENSFDTKSRRYKCRWKGCTKDYGSFEKLSNHILNHHLLPSANVKWTCCYCGKKFSRQDVMQKHIANVSFTFFPLLKFDC